METAFALRCLRVFKNTSWFTGHTVGDTMSRWGIHLWWFKGGDERWLGQPIGTNVHSKK